MDITILAAWGEFLGGIAVVVSLVYLASQIRQNSKLLRSSTASTTSAGGNNWNSLVVQDPEVARIFWDGVADRSSLPEADRRRFDPLMGMWFNNMNQEYQFAIDGVMSPTVWTQRTRGIRRMLREPGMQQCWNEWGDIFSEDFCEFIDGLIREGEAAG